MKVYLGAIRETDQVGILESHAAFSKTRHSNRNSFSNTVSIRLFLSAAPFIPKTTSACLSFRACTPTLRSAGIPGSAASSTTRTLPATGSVRIASWKRPHRPFPSE